MKINLTTRFVITLLLVGFVPVAVLTYLVITATRAGMEGQSDRLHQTAKSTADIIERNLFERYGDVQAFARNEAAHVHKLGTPESRALLEEALNAYVALYGCYPLSMVVDADGRCVAVNTLTAGGKPLNTAPLIGRDYSRTAWFRDARDGRFLKGSGVDGTAVSDVERDPDAAAIVGADALTLNYSAPIRDDSGKVIGVWRNLADFSIVEGIVSSIWALLEHEGLPSAEIAVISSTGVLLAEYDPAADGDRAYRRSFDELLKLNLAHM